jgi:D-alanyl-D-alanine carboxypeptidase (penicillin-binding protein 5/6)
VTVPAGLTLNSTIQVKVRYDGPIKAPIKKGDHVADLVVRTQDGAPQVMPLVAATDVGTAGFFDRVMGGLRYLFGMA